MSDNIIKTRDQVAEEATWDLQTFFASDEAWEANYRDAEAALGQMSQFEGKLKESGATLAQAIDTLFDISLAVENLYVYSHLKNDQDQGNATYQAMHAKASQLYAKYAQATAFIQPEIIAIPAEELEKMIAGNERLQVLEHFLDNISRSRAHVLPPEQELLLANASEIFMGAQNTFGLMNDADFEFPVVQDSDGKDVQLTHGIYSKFLEGTDRRVRKDTFEQFYSVFKQFRNTLAQTLTTQIKTNNFQAKIRGFKSARERALFENNVPEAVYDTLLETVGANLDLLHRYVALRKDLLGVEQLEMYDMYTPLLGEPAIKFTYEEAKEITLKALAPLGEEYLGIMEEAFQDRWIDVYENKGKRSGAYSSGSYASKPYILMNWQDSLNSLYTLVHELGHSAHSYLTHKNQAYEYGDYPIFLAEIASTTNENLLTTYLLETYTDPEVRRYIINYFLDGMKGTVYRQTQFAEFEHFMYQEDQAGTPLTAEFLSENYQKLNAKYYGEAVNSDSDIAYEWSRIPHFYYNYYVFQYSTGFAAATYFAEEIGKGNQEATEKYLNFLRSGNSLYPIDTMAEAGVNMLEKDYLEKALAVFRERLAEFESLL